MEDILGAIVAHLSAGTEAEDQVPLGPEMGAIVAVAAQAKDQVPLGPEAGAIAKLLNDQTAAGIEAVMKAVQAAVGLLGQQEVLLSSLVQNQVMPVDYLSDSAEMAELQRLGIETYVAPTSLKTPSAIPAPSTLKLLMQPGFEDQIVGQMAGVAIEKVTNPSEADFVIGNAAFVKSQRGLSGAMNARYLQVDDASFVERITPTLLAQILHRPELFPAGTVLLIGLKVRGEFGEGLLLFA